MERQSCPYPGMDLKEEAERNLYDIECLVGSKFVQGGGVKSESFSTDILWSENAPLNLADLLIGNATSIIFPPLNASLSTVTPTPDKTMANSGITSVSSYHGQTCQSPSVTSGGTSVTLGAGESATNSTSVTRTCELIINPDLLLPISKDKLIATIAEVPGFYI
jgi:hypothetical protein